MGHPVTNKTRKIPWSEEVEHEGSKVTVRLVMRTDLQALGKLYHEVYDPEVFDVGERWTPESATRMLADLRDRQGAVCILVEIDGEIVAGCFSSSEHWSKGRKLYLNEIFVKPDLQGRGLGRLLIAKTIDYAKTWYPEIRDMELITFSPEQEGKGYGLYRAIGMEDEDLVIMSGNTDEVRANLRPRSERVPAENPPLS